MINSELIKKLQTLPENMEVMFTQTNDESEYSMVNSADIQALTFSSSDVPRNEWATENCIVISDEF